MLAMTMKWKMQEQHDELLRIILERVPCRFTDRILFQAYPTDTPSMLYIYK